MYCDVVCIFLLFAVKCMLIMQSHERLVLSILNRYFQLPHSLKDLESIFAPDMCMGSWLTSLNTI
jgi:hypothetical protein